MVWKPHATVAAIVERDNTFLIVEELIEGERVFNQPAGHLEDGESLIQAVVREVKEETAWVFKPRAILGIYKWKHPTGHHTHIRTSFIGDVTDHDPAQVLDSPIVSADWYSRTDLLKMNLRSPMVMRNIDDYLQGREYSLELLNDV